MSICYGIGISMYTKHIAGNKIVQNVVRVDQKEGDTPTCSSKFSAETVVAIGTTTQESRQGVEPQITSPVVNATFWTNGIT